MFFTVEECMRYAALGIINDIPLSPLWEYTVVMYLPYLKIVVIWLYSALSADLILMY